MGTRARCYGTSERFGIHHVKTCRLGRPACPWRRRAAGQVVCECPAYAFPHRTGSGACAERWRLRKAA